MASTALRPPRDQGGPVRPAPAAYVPGAGDSELPGRVADGDREALAQLYDRFAAEVFGVVARVVRDPAASEQVAQQVFVDAWRTADDVGPDADAATWLLALAHRRAVEHVRREQPGRKQYIGLANDAGIPIGAAGAGGEDAQVGRALHELPELQRAIVELTYLGGDTCRQVSEYLGTPVRTVRIQLRAALRHLRASTEAPA